MAGEWKSTATRSVLTAALSLVALGIVFAIAYLLWCGGHNDVGGELRAGNVLVGLLFLSYGFGLLLSGAEKRSPLLFVPAFFNLALGAAGIVILPTGHSLHLIFLSICVLAGACMILLPPLLAALMPGTMRLLRALVWLLALVLYGMAFAAVSWTRSPWVPAILLLFASIVWLVALVISAAAFKERFLASTPPIEYR